MALGGCPWVASSGEYFPEVCQVVPDGDLPPYSGPRDLLRESHGYQCYYQRKMIMERTLTVYFVCKLIIFPLNLRES